MFGWQPTIISWEIIHYSQQYNHFKLYKRWVGNSIHHKTPTLIATRVAAATRSSGMERSAAWRRLPLPWPRLALVVLHDNQRSLDANMWLVMVGSCWYILLHVGSTFLVVAFWMADELMFLDGEVFRNEAFRGWENLIASKACTNWLTRRPRKPTKGSSFWSDELVPCEILSKATHWNGKLGNQPKSRWKSQQFDLGALGCSPRTAVYGELVEGIHLFANGSPPTGWILSWQITRLLTQGIGQALPRTCLEQTVCAPVI